MKTNSMFLLFILILPFMLSGKDLLLAKNGKTDYKIILIGEKTQLNQFAVKELITFLNRSTGAFFRESATTGKKNIFVGMENTSEPDRPQNDSFVIETKDGNLYLYGRGKYGTLYAVYEFLENILGIRWFSAYGDIKIPKYQILKMKPVKLSGSYAFPVRGIQTFFYKDKKNAGFYHFRNRQNILLPETGEIENFMPELQPKVHTLSAYLNPGIRHKYEHRMAKQLPWIENRNYFTTNPEYFPMNKEGKREPQGQLCFSNMELRHVLNKNITEQLKLELKRVKTTSGILTIDMNDIVYEKFCWCPECIDLEKKYHSPAGAFFEYLSSFSRLTAKKYPGIKIRTLAYMTTIDPPEKLAFADNMIFIFAPIYSNMIVPLEHPGNKSTLNSLLHWKQKGGDIWYWHYPLTYLETSKFLMVPPLANLNRMVCDIQTMKKLGINGTYFEHDSGGIEERTNFTELQSWLMLKLFQNPNADVSGLITEFTDFYYGKAAPLMRQYLYEVENENLKLAENNGSIRYNTVDFPYLTCKNLENWNNLFNQMEKLVQGQPQHEFHVKLVRLGLDSTIISKNAELGNWKTADAKLIYFIQRLKELKIKWNYSYDMNKVKRWTTELEKLFPQKQSQQQDLK